MNFARALHVFLVLLLLLPWLSEACVADENSEEGKKIAARKIVLSIEPYRLMIKALLNPDDEVSVLLDSTVDPHAFQMKPSQLRKISEADLVIWGGKKLEPFLGNVLNSNKAQLVVSDIPGLELLTEQDHVAHEGDAAIDPHIWFSEKNSHLIMLAMARALNHEPYDFSGERKTDSGNMEEKPKAFFIVYHNAYSYLEQDAGVHHDFVIYENHNAKPGLRHWYALKQKLEQAKKENQIVCLLSSPAFDQSTEAEKLRSIIQDTGLGDNFHSEIIDPMARDKRYQNYTQFLLESKNKLHRCLNL